MSEIKPEPRLKIKEMRLERGWSQQDLACRILVSRQSVDHYERGIANPTMKTLKRMATAFNCKIDDLID